MCCAPGALEVDERARRVCLRRSGVAADREGVRPARVARVRSRLGRQPRDDPPPRLGHDVVRRARRPSTCTSRRFARRSATPTRSRRSGASATDCAHEPSAAARLPVVDRSRPLGARGTARDHVRAERAKFALVEGRAGRRRSRVGCGRRARAVSSAHRAAAGVRRGLRGQDGWPRCDRGRPRRRTRRHRTAASRDAELRVAARDPGRVVGAGRERRSDLAAARNRSPLRRRARRLEWSCHGRRPHHVSDVGCRRTCSTVPADPPRDRSRRAGSSDGSSGLRSLGSSRDRWATSRGLQPPLRRAT